jgi:hypothetical protein
MARYPHELRRDGVFSHGWTIRGAFLTGQYRPPRAGRVGVYESRHMRLEYYLQEGRRVRLAFQTPALARGGDRVEGHVEIGRGHRRVEVKSRGTGFRPVEFPVVTGGFLWRYQVLYAPHGEPLAAVVRKGGRFRVDVQEAWGSGPEAPRPNLGQARLYEAAIAMYLAGRIEREGRRRAAIVAGHTGAGGSAGRKERGRTAGPDTSQV